MVNSRRRLPFINFVAILFLFPLVATADCPQEKLKNQGVESLKRHLSAPAPIYNRRTVRLVKSGKKGHLIMHKDPYKPWYSNAKLNKDGLTPQGDVRWPMVIMGPELAYEMGYRIRELSGGVWIFVPSANMIREKRMLMNRNLKKWNLDIVGYSPVSTGFVTPRELVRLGTQGTGDDILQFPYADTDANLAPHEASFHLGALFLPSYVLERVRMINVVTDRLIALIENDRSHFGRLTDKIVSQFSLERAYELDAGTAEFFSITADEILKRQVPFKDLLQQLIWANQRLHQLLKYRIEILMRPTMTPVEAVIRRAVYMFELPYYFVPAIDSNKDFYRSDATENLGRQFSLTEAQEIKMTVILHQLFGEFENENSKYKRHSSESVVMDILSNLDQRRIDLLKALREG